MALRARHQVGEAVHGDAQGNVWVGVGEDGSSPPCSVEFRFAALAKHNIKTRETVRLTNDNAPGVLVNNALEEIRSDPNGNVWFGGSSIIGKYDGQGFQTIETKSGQFEQWSCFDIIPDATVLGTVYAGVMWGGLRVFKAGAWHDCDNPSPEMSFDCPGFIVGLPEGDALLCGYSGLQAGPPIVKLADGAFHNLVLTGSTMNTRFQGLVPSRDGLLAWDFQSLSRLTDSTWAAEEIGARTSAFARVAGVLENSQGTVLVLTQKQLLTRAKGASGPGSWTPANAPAPIESQDVSGGGAEGYVGMKIDGSDRLYLEDSGRGIVVGRPGQNWHRIDHSNVLPGDPFTFAVTESGVLYVSGTGEKGQYLCRIEESGTKTYWLDQLGYPTERVGAIVFDLGGRAWLLSETKNADISRIIIYEPVSEAFHELPLSWAAMPSASGSNYAYSMCSLDRSLAEYGVLWAGGQGFPGRGFPARLNLAPQTRMLPDKKRYSAGEKMQLKKWFANFAGSVAVDWFAAIEDAGGNLFYYPDWSKSPSPAIRGEKVPTDAMSIEDLPPVQLPSSLSLGRCKWRTGFKKAGQNEWLGLGFVESGEFELGVDTL